MTWLTLISLSKKIVRHFNRKPIRLTASFAAACAFVFAVSETFPPFAHEAATGLLLLPVLVCAMFGWQEALVAALGSAFVGFRVLDADAAPTVIWISRACLFGLEALAIAWLANAHERQTKQATRIAAEEGGNTAITRLLDSNVIGMVIRKPDGRLLDANSAFLDMLGYTRADLQRGLRLDEFTPPEGMASDRAAVRVLFSNGRAEPYEKTLRRKDGTEVPTLAHMLLLDDDERILSFTTDLSRVRQMEDQLRQRAEALQLADRRKDEFLAMLGHELRNPLSPILTAADLLGREHNQAHRDRYRRVIHDQVNLLIRLVDDLLDIARIQRGTVQVRREPVNLKDIVRNAAEACREAMTERRHRFFVAVSDDDAWIEADPKRITQVIVNLLNNAARYTEPNGSVWITLERANDYYEITVRDTGIGIDAKFLPRIFDLFAQESTSLDRPHGGLGLGLTLVKKLTELHGGSVSAHSSGRGQGAEFKVRLPRRTLTWSRGPAAGLNMAIESPPRRVLLVDDNFAVAEMTSAFLRNEGHTVSVVHDGPSALANVGAFRPDLILLDIGLPGMDGYQVAKTLIANGCTATLAAVTGYGSPKDRERGAEAGFKHYLIKPVEGDTLRCVLSSLDSKHNLATCPSPESDCATSNNGCPLDPKG